VLVHRHVHSHFCLVAYGDKQDQFKNFAEQAASTKNLLLVEIPITDYGEKENEQLAKEYGVTKVDFPAYKLFLKGRSKPIDYVGDKTADDLKRFLSQHTRRLMSDRQMPYLYR
jgi:endoplasmic reticulum protein 29